MIKVGDVSAEAYTEALHPRDDNGKFGNEKGEPDPVEGKPAKELPAKGSAPAAKAKPAPSGVVMPPDLIAKLIAALKAFLASLS